MSRLWRDGIRRPFHRCDERPCDKRGENHGRPSCKTVFPFSGSFSTAPFENAAASHRGVDELACKPDPVHARLTARARRPSISACRHRQAQAAYPQASDGPPSNACASRRRLPSWPCSGWGLPSRPGHPGRWWSLTPPFHPYPSRGGRAVCFLWHFPAGHPGLPLATTLPCGVRTFLGRRRRDDALGRGRPANSSTLTRIPRKHRGPRGAGIGWASQVPKLCTGGRVRAAEHGPGHSYSRLGSQLRWDVSLIKRTEALPSG